VEAAFAGALGVRLGGPTQYPHQLEIRPTLGDGPPPRVQDLARAVRLSRAVQLAAAVLAVSLSAAGRSGRRAFLRR
jgi:adenosylcobinamide-phosphate synthase